MKKVLVTGASGYIAKHIILQLLQNGYQVRGSLRTMQRAKEVRDAVAPHLPDTVHLDEALSFVPLDLMSDQGWDAALHGMDVLLHTASPFPMGTPAHEDDLIRPAVDGTLRALRAAQTNGVTRVILTSSTAAVIYGDQLQMREPIDEAHWTDVQHPTCNSYSKSKTLAEKAAWAFVEEQFPECRLTTINPGFVLGPPLDLNYGTSMQVMVRLLSAKDPALPKVGFSCVDVRDVAHIHVAAIDRENTFGLRLLAVSGFLWFDGLARSIKSAFPERKIITRVAPHWLIKLLGLFDRQIRQITPMLGVRFDVSNKRAKSLRTPTSALPKSWLRCSSKMPSMKF